MGGLAWQDIWSLFGYAILAALVAGVVCPHIGCYLLVRRTGFYGITLPQFAAAGVAFGWALPLWLLSVGATHVNLEVAQLESPHAVKNYLLLMAALFTFGGLAVLLLLNRHKETETGRVAAAFAIASAATILLASVSPHGGEVIDQLLRGEILTADLHEFDTIGVAYALVFGLAILFRNDLLLVSFDRDMAKVLGRPVRRFEALLMALIGITVSVGVLIVGPVVLFGLLVLPPLAAHGLAWSMRSYLVLASLLGVLSAAGGIWASFQLDWSLGPAVVAVAGVLLVPAFVTGIFVRRRA